MILSMKVSIQYKLKVKHGRLGVVKFLEIWPEVAKALARYIGKNIAPTARRNER